MTSLATNQPAAIVPPLCIDLDKMDTVGAVSHHLAIGNGTHIHFVCDGCGHRTGTTRADLPRFWRPGRFVLKGDSYFGGTLLCGQCKTPHAAGKYAPADVWLPVAASGTVWSWLLWDELFRDWVIQHWTNLESTHRRARRELREALPRELKRWASDPGSGDALPDVVMATELAIKYAALDERVARLEPLYDFMECGHRLITAPWELGLKNDMSVLGRAGIVPGIYDFFVDFLNDSSERRITEWRKFMRAYRKSCKKATTSD